MLDDANLGSDSRGLQAVLFDMDGLFVDTEQAWFDAEHQVMTTLGGTWDDAAAAAMVGGPLDRVARFMVDRIGSGDVEAVERLIVATMHRLLRDGTQHRPGADSLLAELVEANIPCALVSSSPRVLVDAVLASVGDDGFRFSLAGDEVARTKPHPDPYLEAAGRLNADPSRCVVLEDSPTGVAAGEAAGCVVVAVPFVAAIEPVPGRLIVGSLAELSVDSLIRMV